MSEQPFASIIIPTHNRVDSLTRCIASLAAQTYPADRFEIIVVNDGGGTVPESVRGNLDPRTVFEVIDVKHGGPAAARNAGVARARGEILAFIDDDCVADSQWLEALVTRLTSQRDAVVGGRVVNALEHNRYSRASQLLVSQLYRYYHEQGRGDLPFFTTNSLATRAETFARIGPFDASFPFASEDRDWSDRCLLAGAPLVYAPEAVVHHEHDLTLTTFFQQHFRYGEGARRFHGARARRRGTGVRLEAPAFYAGLLRAPFDASDPEAVRVALLIIASQVVGAAGWALSGVKRKKEKPAVPR
jgi:GT2 family glycosyltransferase